ncbi:MAG TPA: hypothetical protein ACFYEB_07145 [Candidatus Brocadiia bacterium]|nr:hypothetical protein [Planctomycetota bacterium]
MLQYYVGRTLILTIIFVSDFRSLFERTVGFLNAYFFEKKPAYACPHADR